MPDELLGECTIPEELSHIWLWFAELGLTRTAGFNSLNPISYMEIKAWADLTGRTPTHRDIERIRALDALFLRTISEKD